MSNSDSVCNVVSLAEAFDSVSEGSEGSLASSCDRSRSRGRLRKRTRTGNLTSSHSRSTRLKHLYKDDYRELFNMTVDETLSNRCSTAENLLEESQIGISMWNSEEKRVFFRALARRGPYDIRGIATDIGTKSESEVEVYSELLYKASLYQQSHSTRKSLLDTSSLDTALELKEDCCTALDLTAEALSALQQNEEEKAEKKKHKDLALLTPRIAKWIEHCIVVTKEEKAELANQIPAASLLNLMNFLTLSRRFFMNSSIAEENWRSYSKRGIRSPSITYTAFSDLYALVISITQRLVQSSLYFAMSRLRVTSTSGYYTPESHVRRRDVKAAIDVLSMKTDAKLFWARVARKSRLRVYDRMRHRQVFGKRYSYAELERVLSTGISDPDRSGMIHKDASSSRSRRGNIILDQSASTSDDSVSAEGNWSCDFSNGEEPSTTPVHSTGTQNLKQEAHEDLQEAYLKAFDLQTSRNEECRLWEKLCEDPREKMEPLDVKLPKRPFPVRKDEIELLQWRDSVDYVRDWEASELSDFGSSFANSENFKMDVESAAGLTSSGYSSGGAISDDSTHTEHGSDTFDSRDGETNDDRNHETSAEDEKDFTGQ